TLGKNYDKLKEDLGDYANFWIVYHSHAPYEDWMEKGKGWFQQLRTIGFSESDARFAVTHRQVDDRTFRAWVDVLTNLEEYEEELSASVAFRNMMNGSLSRVKAFFEERLEVKPEE